MAVTFSMKRRVLTLLLSVVVSTSNAFVLSKKSRHSSTASSVTPKESVIGQRIRLVDSPQGWAPTDRGTCLLVGRSPDNNEGSSYDFWSRNKARTDVRSFLTQRSIQSFVYLLNQCREEHSVRWLEKSLEFTNIDKFHGTGAFNRTTFPEWDSIFLNFMNREEEVVVITVRQRRQRRGLSGMNNYLDSLSKPATTSANHEDEDRPEANELSRNPYLDEKTIDFEFDVDPSALVRRMLSVREQLANEWIQDLDMLMKLNDDIMEAYEDYLNSKDEAAMKEDEDYDDEEGDDEDDVENALVDEDDESLKKLPAPYSVPEPESTAEKNVSDDTKSPIFDRNAVFAWSQSLFAQDRDSSPFRKKNFDLLLLLSTQESIHRVLKQYKNGKEKVSLQSYEWFLDFYKERVRNYFDGDQNYGRAEDFLEELLQTNPIVFETAREVVAFIDPARIAEDVVRERSEVALEWMGVAKTIPEEHTDLRRMLLTNMVTKALPWQSTSESILAESGVSVKPSITNKEGKFKEDPTKDKAVVDEDDKFKNAVGVFE